VFLLLLSPFAPHIAEELWQRMGNDPSVTTCEWPVWDESKLAEEQVTIVVQVNGRLRANFSAAADASKEDLEGAALGLDKIRPHVEGKTVRKVVVVPGKLVNIVAN
jgi:leucyl-tRNA synthetase